MMISIKSPTIPTLPTNLHSRFPRHLKISCANGNREAFSDDALAAELSLRFRKLNSRTAEREEALKKSRQILFAEVCDFAGLRSEELRRIWRRMSEEDRRGLAKGFVAEWSARWHPLSARSVEEMVDEHLGRHSRVSDAQLPDSALVDRSAEGKPTAAESSGGNLPRLSPAFLLGSGDHPGLSLTSVSLNETNYLTWSHNIETSLLAKSKLGYIDGTLPKPMPGAPEYDAWRACDAIIRSWFANSISTDLQDGFVFVSSAQDLWQRAKGKFGQSNGVLIYELKGNITELRQ